MHNHTIPITFLLLKRKPRVNYSMKKKRVIIRTKCSAVLIRRADITQRRCASVATIGLAERKRHGLANTLTSFTIRRDSARIAIFQNIIVIAKKKEDRKMSASRMLLDLKHRKKTQTRLSYSSTLSRILDFLLIRT